MEQLFLKIKERKTEKKKLIKFEALHGAWAKALYFNTIEQQYQNWKEERAREKKSSKIYWLIHVIVHYQTI